MYLIDTSVWIDYFRGKSNKPVQFFTSILDKNVPFGITNIIYQEILQGASTEKDFNKLNQYLSTQIFYHPKRDLLSYQTSAKIYFNGRRNGITIRSTIDCLIAQIAIENKLILVHNDKDFVQMQKILPTLKLAV